MDWNWLDVICIQVMCDDVNDWVYVVYVLRSKLPAFFVWGYVQSILHGKYMSVAEACINV